MARIFKPTYTKNGETRTSSKYWLEFYVSGRRKPHPLRVRDKNAAKIKAGTILHKAELRQSGAVAPFETHRERPLEDHLRDFETHLEQKDVTDKHRHERVAFVREFVAATAAGSI